LFFTNKSATITDNVHAFRQGVKKMMKRMISLSLAALLIILALVSCGEKAPEPSPAAKPKTYSSPPAMTIDTSKKYTATIETEKGNMVLELFAKDVPVTVNNFVFLAREGFYDGSTFHRVIPGFMAQGGDPTGTGMGTAGYLFDDEFTGHKHEAGTLSMANSGANTNSAQFFITFTPQPGLDGKHTVFGQLIEGRDVLDSLTARDPSQNPQFEGDKILRITIEES
jgi:cyclophilin family peptidyl-prolyl cis-trans isomerase/predicted small lipoprotein YifL